MAGVVPGLVLVCLFVGVVLLWGRIYPSESPTRDKTDKLPLKEILSAIGPVILIGLTITVAIYTGIATPTEAAAISALLTIILAFTVGGLTIQGFIDALKSTLKTMGYLGLLMSAGVLFGFVLTYYRVPQQFSDLFLALQLSPYLILGMIILFYVIIGMFLDPISMTVITLPTLFPLISAAGFDMIWFGVVYTITMEVAMLTPPVGLNLYVIQGLSPKNIQLSDVIYGSLPFIGALVTLIALMIAFPDIALWLPEAMD